MLCLLCCAVLWAAAGKLTLTHFLQLEAASLAAGDGSASDADTLLHPGAADAVLRLCCSLCVGSAAPASPAGSLASNGAGAEVPPGSVHAPLDCLVEPLGAVWRSGGGGAAPAAAGLAGAAGTAAASVAPNANSGEAVLMVPDTDDEGEEEQEEEATRQAREGGGRACAGRHPTAAAEAALASSVSSASPLMQGLAAAVATALLHPADAAEQQSEQQQQQQQRVAATASLAVCQKACAHILGLLVRRPLPGMSVGRLLPVLLAGVVQHCKRQWAVQAAARQQAQQWMGVHEQQQLHLEAPQAAADERQAQQQAVVALASGLLLELLPQPLGSSHELVKQRQQLTALAAAVGWGLSEAAGAGGQGLVARLEAVMDE
jgi:hypothetical protein